MSLTTIDAFDIFELVRPAETEVIEGLAIRGFTVVLNHMCIITTTVNTIVNHTYRSQFTTAIDTAIYMATANNVDMRISANASGILKRCEEIGHSINSTARCNRAVVCCTMFITAITTTKDTAVDDGSSYRRSDSSIISSCTTKGYIDIVTCCTILWSAIDIPLDSTTCDIDR